jgi:hypothetical protein
MNNNPIFVILTPSARGWRDCFLGEGASEESAWLDALGPKPWGPHAKRIKKNAWCQQVSPEELEDLRESVHD